MRATAAAAVKTAVRAAAAAAVGARAPAAAAARFKLSRPHLLSECVELE